MQLPQPLQTYLAKLDAQLARMDDAGEKFTLLNHVISDLERKRNRLIDWAYSDEEGPTPFGPKVDGLSLNQLIMDVEARKVKIEHGVRARIIAAERSPSFAHMMNDIGEAFAAAVLVCGGGALIGIMSVLG